MQLQADPNNSVGIKGLPRRELACAADLRRRQSACNFSGAEMWLRRFYERVGRNIATERKAQALLQWRLAELAGFLPSEIALCERGKFELGLSGLQRIADALRVTGVSLLRGAFE